MINLTVKYRFISKLVLYISEKFTRAYRFMPAGLFIPANDKQYLTSITKVEFKTLLQHELGVFTDESVRSVSEQEARQIHEYARQSLNHTFEVLGSGWVKHAQKINWHTDFKTGFEWKKGTFYKNYETVNLSNSSDVKVPWDMSRCHHLLWMGEAYLLNKDERYVSEIISQIEDWMDENPFMYSINWTCAMDVSIRAINWMYAVNMIIDSEKVSETFIQKLVVSLYHHGVFVYRNLEKGFPYSANHYAANITGLVFLGGVFKNTHEGCNWLRFGKEEFYKEVREQLLPTGVHFERSISYHRLMTELFYYSYLKLKRTGEDIPLDVEYRISSMFDFILHYTEPNGKAPLIGDNDDGRLLPFVPSSLYDHRYLIAMSAISFNNSLHKKYALSVPLDACFLIGTNAAKQFAELPVTNDDVGTKSFADAGFYIIRREKFYMIISNTGVSRYPDTTKPTVGTHTHADLLSFELAIGNTSFIVDPGTFVYTASARDRNLYRGTAKHNTITVNDSSQYSIPENDLFSVVNTVSDIQGNLHENYPHSVFEGSYRTSTNQHKRIFSCNLETLECVLTDAVNIQASGNVKSYLHFAPGLNIVITNPNTVKIKNNGGDSISVSFLSDTPFVMTVQDDTVSPSYGVVQSSQTLQISAEVREKFTLQTSIKYNQHDET